MTEKTHRQKLILPQDFIDHAEARFFTALSPDLRQYFPQEQTRDVYLVHKEGQHLLGIESCLRWNPYDKVLRHTGITWGVVYPIEVNQRPGRNPTGYIYLRPFDSTDPSTLKIQTTNFQTLNIVSGEESAAKYKLQNCWCIDDVVDRLGEYVQLELKVGRDKRLPSPPPKN
ncbi:hypothetical protein HYT55_04140 [Candidatus Woesearchaeota archaeon]|nr:hypothetical protein [Candidatus Woesearchaeota archaeon]